MVAKGFVPWFDSILAHYHLKLLSIDVGQLEPKRLFMRSVYLYVMGLLLGYMAEQQKQLRAEKAAIARILANTGCEHENIDTTHGHGERANRLPDPMCVDGECRLSVLMTGLRRF